MSPSELVLMVVGLGAASGSVAGLACWAVRRVSLRAGAMDTDAMPGQVKERARRVPNTGGIGIFWAIALPVLFALLGAHAGGDLLPEWAARHAAGVRGESGLAAGLFGSLLAMHALGLVDDRRPLGPFVKLAVMAAPPLLLACLTETRLLSAFDVWAGGRWLSVIATVLWFLAVTNAMNFIDNMDGLTAGVSAIAAAALIAAAGLSGQWFVAGLAACVVGACGGFLIWNWPPARLFMGDGGSLVLGFVLAFLSTRLTYVGEGPTGETIGTAWWAVLTPLVVLALPLYDMTSVTMMRLRQGRSPMRGDLQHLSHRLVKRGLSKRRAVLVIWGLTAVTAISGVSIGSVSWWQAVLIGVQVAVLLAVIAAVEFGSSPPGARHDSLDGVRASIDTGGQPENKR